MSVRAAMFGIVVALAVLGGAGGPLAPAAASAEEPLPPQLKNIGIDERLGAQVPLDLPFVDQTGARVTLRDYLRPGRPLVLTLNYYACPTLCTIVLNGLLEGMRDLGFRLGHEYDVVTVSIDPAECPALASVKRRSYIQGLGQTDPGPSDRDWPFLTGQKADIQRLADAVGFHFAYDAETKQFAHAAGVFVLTPEGKISRVLYGIEFPRRDLRLALVEASRGGISAPVERLLLFCYHYDSQVRHYGLTPMGVMRIGGVLTFVALCSLLLVLWRRERRAPVVHD